MDVVQAATFQITWPARRKALEVDQIAAETTVIGSKWTRVGLQWTRIRPR